MSDAIMDQLHQLVRKYRHSLQTDRRHLLEEFQLLQIARKVVGVGSVGTRAWILLMRAGTTTTSSSSRPRRQRPRCWRSSWARAATPPTAHGWSPAST